MKNTTGMKRKKIKIARISIMGILGVAAIIIAKIVAEKVFNIEISPCRDDEGGIPDGPDTH